MAMGGFMLVKNLLLLINFLSLLGGLILISGGGWIQSHQSEDALSAIVSSIATGAIVIGVFVTLVSFMGCFGAANERGILLKTYFGLLALLIIFQIAIGSAAYSKREDIPELVGEAWKDLYLNSNQTIQTIEAYFQCCGFHNTTDMAVPSTCQVSRFDLSNKTGCLDAVTNSLDGQLSTIGGAGLALGIIEFIGLIFSALLFRRIAQKERASDNLMNEAWRINRSKIQYGYQNYQYV
ncbi:hypothetical protein SmJEL517_g05180 [Synchytrium microbalum]|uniref:Tetraspanin n=1 Tax=Synchytrium microbalum TaxID=1806994 RepID=A0A507C0I1_9FUNG|nr:uncharacterized protein SmJEL517_g05180 [Synchytrium microbalum]TPX31476.1 hypothetical protein SmJEL517_g05180 [Synchytrium microbalum]